MESTRQVRQLATSKDQAGIKVQGGHRYRYLPISWNMPHSSKQHANQQTFETQDSKYALLVDIGLRNSQFCTKKISIEPRFHDFSLTLVDTDNVGLDNHHLMNMTYRLKLKTQIPSDNYN
jgi:hypothetical protein